MPQSQEANTNNRVEIKNNRTSPKRFASQPVIGIEMAFATPNEVITQVPCSELTPRLPEMVGRATLAMVVSSTCMKVARDRPMVAITRLGGEKLLLSLMLAGSTLGGLAVVFGEVGFDQAFDQLVGRGQLLLVDIGGEQRFARWPLGQGRAALVV